MTEKIRVALGTHSYDIVVGENLLARAGEIIAPHLPSRNVIIISDNQVSRFWLHRLSNALEAAKISYRSIVVPAGEQSKSISQFGELLEDLLSQAPDRKTSIIALGGGVVGDLAGFAASVLLRGVPYIQIPTSLLAQVDSAVGGKTAINSQHGKNLIGSFHQPLLVLTDVATLTTLPARELKAGYAEILKYGLIGDAAFFAWLEQNGEKILAGDAAATSHGIIESCKAKATIVAADEKEHGKRALLNFGHTFAHALEAETGMGDALLHGEAVAIGMVLALRASVMMKLCPQADYDRVLAHYQKTGLPHRLPASHAWDAAKIMHHFSHDKKANAGKPTFILTHGIGSTFIEQSPNMEAIRQTLVEACANV
ncbi:MAG: 3-dehydroquinate synthase [Alphaproteobacteria bacterium]